MLIKIIKFQKAGSNYNFDFEYVADPGDSFTGAYNLNTARPGTINEKTIENTLRQAAVDAVNNNFSPTAPATLADASMFVPTTPADRITGLALAVVASLKPIIFKSNVSGGSGGVSFSLVDGSGNALYPNLTADKCTAVIDGVSDQYAFSAPTVSSDKKTVTVTAQRQNFSSGNVLITLLGAITSALTGVTYVNAANGIGVKLIVSE